MMVGWMRWGSATSFEDVGDDFPETLPRLDLQ